MRVRGIAYVCIDGKVLPIEVEQEIRGALVDVYLATHPDYSIAEEEADA